MSRPVRRGRTNSKLTPVRAALKTGSPLRELVKNGLDAVLKAHRSYFEESVRNSFADSLDVDNGLKSGNEQDNRWDYLLGQMPSRSIIAVEPHSAKADEISTVIKKRAAARKQLRDHLCDGVKVSKWLWVASGDVYFLSMESAKRELDEHGIEFVGKKIRKKHLG